MVDFVRETAEKVLHILGAPQCLEFTGMGLFRESNWQPKRIKSGIPYQYHTSHYMKSKHCLTSLVVSRSRLFHIHSPARPCRVCESAHAPRHIGQSAIFETHELMTLWSVCHNMWSTERQGEADDTSTGDGAGAGAAAGAGADTAEAGAEPDAADGGLAAAASRSPAGGGARAPMRSASDTCFVCGSVLPWTS